MTGTTMYDLTDEISAEQTDFAYDAQGNLISVKAPDGMVTLTQWYLPGEPAGERTVAIPDTLTLTGGLTLPDDSALKDAGFDVCPTLAKTEAPRLQARLQYLRLADGTFTEGELTLFGYGGAKGNTEDKVLLTIEGVNFYKEAGRRMVTAAGRKPLITLTRESVVRRAGSVYTRREKICWYDGHRLMQATEEVLSPLDSDAGWLTTLTATLPSGSKAILKQQVTSSFSGILLREAQMDGDGYPVSFVVFTYDFDGREVLRTAYEWNEDAFLSGNMATLTPLAPALVAPVREAMPYGIWEREQSEDGRWLYVRYDGHQRPLSRWLQRVPGDDHADSNRVCIERVAYGADGTVAGSHVFDYLPGGLCERIIDAVRPPHKAESWFWQAENSRVTQSVDKLTGALTVTRLQGRMDGTVTGSTVTTQTNLPDGRVRFESESRAGEPENSGQSKPGMLQARTRQETDSRGRLVKLTESVETVMISKGEETRKWKERDWALTYDDLGRRTTVTAPDGRVVTWAYEGLCDVPTGITLKQGAKGKPLPLGSRTLPSGDGVASLTRGKGATEWYTEKGRIRADGTTLYALEDEKDHTLTVYREKDKEKSALATFRINPATLVLRNVRLAGKDQQLEVVNESLTPALLGEYRLDRIVAGITARAQGMASLRGRVTSGRSTSGVPSAGRPTPQGMPQRVRRGELEYRYQWTPEGQCAQAAVRDLRTGHCLVADYRYDFAGNETERRYSLGDTTGVKEMVRWEQAWTSQGQLRTAALYRRDVLTRTETFTYETQESGLRDELINWAVSVQIPGTDEVCDRDGRAIRLQAYTYDTLGNMTGCSTRFADEQTETRTYAYGDADQPSRRTQERVTSSGATTSHALSYDMAGNLMASGPRYFTYTAEGQLASAGEGGILLTRYDYDANGALTATWDAASMTTRILTGDAEMCLDSQGQPVSRRIDDTEAGLVTVCQVLSGKEGETVSAEMLYFTLAAPGTCGGDEWWVDERGDWHYRSAAFTPWGESAKHSLDSMASGLGWNRMNADAAGLYHMGGGYRAYDPCERTFCQPDGLSPFGAGGLNDRAYCAYRDPVNWHDPSGHVMLNRFAVREQLATLDQWISETTLPSPKAAAWWEWVLLGAGALAFVVAMVMSGGALAAILPGIVGLIGIGAKGVGMAMRQGEPELAAKMEFTGDILSAVGGLLMPMTGVGAVTSALLRTAEAASLGLSMASYVLSESNPALAEKLGWASMGLGFAWAGHGLVKGATRLGNKGLERLRSLRAQIKLYGAKITLKNRGNLPLLNVQAMAGAQNNFRAVEHGLYLLEEKSLDGLRKNLVVLAHGDLVSSSPNARKYNTPQGIGVVLSDSEVYNAADFVAKLTTEVKSLSQFSAIELRVCYSANGASSSLAQQISTKTGLPVIGYKNKAYVTLGSDTVGQMISQNMAGMTLETINRNMNKAFYDTSLQRFINKAGSPMTFGEPVRGVNTVVHFNP